MSALAGYSCSMEGSGDDDEFQDDAALFRAAIGPVRKLPATAPPPAKARPTPIPRMARRDEDAALDEFRMALDQPLLEAGDALSWRRDTVSSRTLQRLRRGQYAVQDELDLHHVDVRQAESLLRTFIKQAQHADFGCVRIIHGKGLHSASGAPLLKNMVDRMLRQRADVLAFHSAPASGGGTGAVLVLLAPRRKSS